MIGRDEYIAALDIVEQYHKQIGLPAARTIREFLSKNAGAISVRLYNALASYAGSNEDTPEAQDIYLLRFRHLNQFRGFGKKGWQEFEAILNNEK